uniref:Uncharacterized protein n=1 Tax=Rhizophagus irregularis (strain DAOM 181602 / DAOM 197198 / MUCL 43194) TaxID=747089 RepID=U9UCS5_RHIID
MTQLPVRIINIIIQDFFQVYRQTYNFYIIPWSKDIVIQRNLYLSQKTSSYTIIHSNIQMVISDGLTELILAQQILKHSYLEVLKLVVDILLFEAVDDLKD